MKTKYVKPEIVTVEMDRVSILSGSSIFDDPTISDRGIEID
jgi:hypothetical protein